MTTSATYEGYRESGISWLEKIPSHWSVTKFKRYCDIQLGKMLQPQPNTPRDIQVPYLRAVHVQWERVESSDLPEMWASEKEVKKFQVKSGDLLVCEGGEVGRTSILKNIEGDCIIQNALHRIRGNGNTFTPYINYLMRHIADAKWFEILCNKATIAHLTGEKLGELGLPLPSIDEQQAIARYLDFKTAQIDTLIAKKKTLLEKLADKRTALISHAVTKGLDPSVPMKDSGVVWLGSIPKHWKQGVKLNYLALPQKNSFVNGPFGSDLLSSELTDTGIPVIYSGDVKPGNFFRKSSSYVTEEKAQQLNFCRVDPGDLLLAKVGDPPGDAAIYPIDAVSGIVTQDVVRIKLNAEIADTDYVCFLLNSKYGRQIVQTVSVEATRGRFSLGDFKALRFVIPPLAEQASISKYLARQIAPIRCQEIKVLEVISKLQEYRSALITNAVTGKIDVREFHSPVNAAT